MFRYQKLADDQRAHIYTLRGVVGLQLLVIGGLWYGWQSAPHAITVHIPPDLRAGATQGINEIPDYNVYVFAHYIFQQLHRWPEDGAVDFGQRIYALSAYLTPAYRIQLLATLHARGQEGELAERVRAMQLVPGHGYEESRVQVLDQDAWIVRLDLELIETVRGLTVKNPLIRYPLRVVRYAVDPEHNPWGLALAGYGDPPTRINLAEEAPDE